MQKKEPTARECAMPEMIKGDAQSIIISVRASTQPRTSGMLNVHVHAHVMRDEALCHWRMLYSVIRRRLLLLLALFTHLPGAGWR